MPHGTTQRNTRVVLCHYAAMCTWRVWHGGGRWTQHGLKTSDTDVLRGLSVFTVHHVPGIYVCSAAYVRVCVPVCLCMNVTCT